MPITLRLNDTYTYGVLAHEFQHMIHWKQDRNETSWMNEGFSEVAVLLNGYYVGGADTEYIADTDIRVPHENIVGRRSGILGPEFVSTAEAMKDLGSYESWSRFCLEHLDTLLAKAAAATGTHLGKTPPAA